MRIISANLDKTDLHVDQIYGGSRNGSYSDDPLPKLLKVDNGAGFRCIGSPRTDVKSLKVLALQTSFSDLDWPDAIDRENGLFTYYGDKRSPGDLHDTKRDGNKILKELFDFCHSSKVSTPSNFPVILLFGRTGTYRDNQFLGLAVPGSRGMSSDEDLVAVWRTTKDGIRFQNYKSVFTILDVPTIDRKWINDAKNGRALSSPYAPKEWINWVQNRQYTPLISKHQHPVRSKSQQTDLSNLELKIIEAIHSKFKDTPYKFESCAAELVKLAMPSTHSIELTRPWRDGGRDATGKHRIGYGDGYIDVDFAMEAKCYKLSSGVGVAHTSRLISRLRHRQFGIMVTTSYLGAQAYQEIVSDDHPIIVLSAKDIARLMISKLKDFQSTSTWLEQFN